MNYYTSDWHLGEDRLGGDNGKPNLFYRPWKSSVMNDANIFSGIKNSGFRDGDTLWNLGDVIVNPTPYNQKKLAELKKEYPNSKFNLVVGDYDKDKLDLLRLYFDMVWDDGGYIHMIDTTKEDPYLKVLLNHYPIKCKSIMDRDVVTFGNKPISFALTGHIYGLWKVQKGMINVGIDTWWFKPVSEVDVLGCWNAMQKFYDENVFPYT
jgi:calcineurin-like phosphoesterase family protein